MDLDQALARVAELEAESVTQIQSLSEKDAKIEDMARHAREKSEQFKKLRDMTTSEKELLSEKELELMKRQEGIEEISRKTAEDQQAFRQEQRASVLKGIVNKFARGDIELAKKIEFNIAKIKDSDLAMTEEMLAPIVQDGFNMVGVAATDAVRNANNQGGSVPEYASDAPNYANTPEGQELSAMMFGAPAPAPVAAPVAK